MNLRSATSTRPLAHKDHVHLELNWPAARRERSFWRSPLGD
jgi:hypothetical protein